MISVGMDVSKGKSTVCIMKPGGEVLRKPFELTHTKEDIRTFAEFIRSLNDDVKFVMESTGHYHCPVAYSLHDEGFFVCVVNPYRMMRFCSQNIRRAKTDRIDSINIALFGICYWHELVPISSANDIYNEMRMLSKQYSYTIELIVKAKMNLKTLAERSMPNIETLVKNNKRHSKFIDFVNRYWHYDNILQMGEKKFCRDYINWAKNRDTITVSRKQGKSTP